MNNSNKHLWTDEYGFWSNKGCRLKREDMPDTCRIYNCHTSTFMAIMRYDTKWRVIESIELRNEEITPVKLAVNATINAQRDG